VRAFQVLIALTAVFLSPLVGLVAPAIAFFVVASGLSGLSAASWRRSTVAAALLTGLQVAALAGSLAIALQSAATSDEPRPMPAAAAIPAAAPGSMPAADRAAP